MPERFPRHFETTTHVEAPVAQVFAHLDDHSRLSAHMTKPSWKMGGGHMDLTADSGGGRRAGSTLRLAGRVFGLQLFVEEVVVTYDPPQRKMWETTGEPRLIAVGAYRMGFTLAPQGSGSELSVSIDYDIPQRGVSRWLARAFSGYYARWCTRRMATDASRHFLHEPKN